MASRSKKETKQKRKGFVRNYEKNKELFWILFFMVVVIIVLLVSSAIFRSFNHFSYKGLSFTKERYNQIPIYYYYYYFTEPVSNIQYKYNLYLRLDPRKNNIPINATIIVPHGKTVYITLNSSAFTNCNNSRRDVATLAAFFANNFINLSIGAVDKQEAASNNLSNIDCDTYPENAIIKMEGGNETRIYQQYNCYIMDIANCQTLEVVEKFEVQAILDAKARNQTGQQ
jgi:hypothetical protein